MKVGLKDFKRPDVDFTHLVNLDPPPRENTRKPKFWASGIADLFGLLTLIGLCWLAMIVLSV